MIQPPRLGWDAGEWPAFTGGQLWFVTRINSDVPS